MDILRLKIELTELVTAVKKPKYFRSAHLGSVARSNLTRVRNLTFLSTGDVNKAHILGHIYLYIILYRMVSGTIIVYRLYHFPASYSVVNYTLANSK